MSKTILYGIGCAVIGAIVSLNVYHDHQHHQALDAHGQTVVVDPINHYTETTHTKYGIKTSSEYSAKVSFKTVTGTPMSVDLKMPESILKNFEAAQDVKIDYLPEDPSVTRWTGEPDSCIKDALGGAFVILVGVALIVSWFRGRNRA